MGHKKKQKPPDRGFLHGVYDRLISARIERKAIKDKATKVRREKKRKRQQRKKSRR